MQFTKISKKVTQVTQTFPYEEMPGKLIELEVEKDGIIYKSWGWNTDLGQRDPRFQLLYKPENNPNVYLNGVKLIAVDLNTGARYGAGYTFNFERNTICISLEAIVAGDVLHVDYFTREKIENNQKTYLD